MNWNVSFKVECGCSGLGESGGNVGGGLCGEKVLLIEASGMDVRRDL